MQTALGKLTRKVSHHHPIPFHTTSQTGHNYVEVWLEGVWLVLCVWSKRSHIFHIHVCQIGYFSRIVIKCVCDLNNDSSTVNENIMKKDSM